VADLSIVFDVQHGAGLVTLKLDDNNNYNYYVLFNFISGRVYPVECDFLRTGRGKRIWQLDPANPCEHKQIPGPTHLPPRRHFGLQTAV